MKSSGEKEKKNEMRAYDEAKHHFPSICFQLPCPPPPCLGLPLCHWGGEDSAAAHVVVHVSSYLA